MLTFPVETWKLSTDGSVTGSVGNGDMVTRIAESRTSQFTSKHVWYFSDQSRVFQLTMYQLQSTFFLMFRRKNRLGDGKTVPMDLNWNMVADRVELIFGTKKEEICIEK